ncbi:RagB/SusD family nutrient uptake outer membrane protein [Hymenobacter convexus]|uniref:RagB/SusD family nutrient uptake outer membrane protein n=1 Tax=Hymenobacter sp. CA1UV-4 TaxID=3063782 RepID=UPI002712F587|nr:RagB/SusD family nutrient uptake outer membrane protein [Hymenobacter sp. CA1UV-4]MDO7852705.1 RagB/SusD family nutrient uptake outer membrane protein [Hymenobacter sp. CA1UV-4]
MNRIITKKAALAACAAFLALGTFSCRPDLLNPTPTTAFSDKVVFDTPARIALQVNNLYSYTKSGSFLGGRYQIFSDIRANDFINRTSNGVTGQSVWNHTLTEASQNDVINTWGAGYAAINQINVFLAGMDANAAKFVAPTFPTDFGTTANQYRGEARLLRALCYYSLLQLYARPYADGNGSKPGLPLRLRAETDDTGNDLARSSVAEVYAQILADLNFAEQNLPLTYGTSAAASTLNTTRAHRNTAIALKTRVYLSMGQYANVITEANKIVPAAAPFTAATGVPNSLNASVAAVFAVPQETTESILSFPFTAQDPPGTQNQLAYYFLPTSLGGGGEYGLNTAAGGILANPAFAATDARRTSFVAVVTTGTSSESFLKKYPTGSPYTDKAPAIRYAEVLLSLAEARVRSTNTIDPQALLLLNAVRGRSNAAGVYTAASFTSAAAMADAIVLERRIEFLGEGIRNHDLMRLLATIPAKSSVPAIDPTNTIYVWPIPSTELATNKLMTRN